LPTGLTSPGVEKVVKSLHEKQLNLFKKFWKNSHDGQYLMFIATHAEKSHEVNLFLIEGTGLKMKMFFRMFVFGKKECTIEGIRARF